MLQVGDTVRVVKKKTAEGYRFGGYLTTATLNSENHKVIQIDHENRSCRVELSCSDLICGTHFWADLSEVVKVV